MKGLWDAVRRGDAAAVRAALATGATVDERDRDGQTALHLAARDGRAEVAAILLAAGADPDAADRDGARPIDLVIGDDRFLDVVQVLLDGGADPEGRDEHGTLLYLAAQAPGQLSALLAHGADPDATTANGESALSFACSWGHLDSVEILLACGADPHHVVEGVDWTPLLFAVEADRPAIVAALLAAGVDPTWTNPRGCTALSVALDHGRFAIAERLIDHDPAIAAAGLDVVALAGRRGRADLVARLEVLRWSPAVDGLRGRAWVAVGPDGVDVHVEVRNVDVRPRTVRVDDPHALGWSLVRGDTPVEPAFHRTDVISSPRDEDVAPGDIARWRASMRSDPGQLDLVTVAWDRGEHASELRGTWGALALPSVEIPARGVETA